MKKINIVLIVLFLGITFSCKAQQRQENIATEIIGTWIAEDDTESKLEFRTDGILLEHYGDKLTGAYNYSIADKCGNEQDENSWFLKTVDKEDNEEQCYELYGADSSIGGVLSMRFMSNGKIFVYNKS